MQNYKTLVSPFVVHYSPTDYENLAILSALNTAFRKFRARIMLGDTGLPGASMRELEYLADFYNRVMGCKEPLVIMAMEEFRQEKATHFDDINCYPSIIETLSCFLDVKSVIYMSCLRAVNYDSNLTVELTADILSEYMVSVLLADKLDNGEFRRSNSFARKFADLENKRFNYGYFSNFEDVDCFDFKGYFNFLNSGYNVVTSSAEMKFFADGCLYMDADLKGRNSDDCGTEFFSKDYQNRSSDINENSELDCDAEFDDTAIGGLGSGLILADNENPGESGHLNLDYFQDICSQNINDFQSLDVLVELEVFGEIEKSLNLPAHNYSEIVQVHDTNTDVTDLLAIADSIILPVIVDVAPVVPQGNVCNSNSR